MISSQEMISYLAATLTTASFLPQAIFKATLDARSPVLCLIEDDAGLRWLVVRHQAKCNC